MATTNSYRPITSPPTRTSADKALLKDCLRNAGVDMVNSNEWFPVFYEDLQKHILSVCRGDRNTSDDLPSKEYLTVGAAVVTDGSLPEDILKESGGFVIAVQDLWRARNWIFKMATRPPVLDDENDSIEL